MVVVAVVVVGARDVLLGLVVGLSAVVVSGICVVEVVVLVVEVDGQMVTFIVILPDVVGVGVVVVVVVSMVVGRGEVVSSPT